MSVFSLATNSDETISELEDVPKTILCHTDITSHEFISEKDHEKVMKGNHNLNRKCAQLEADIIMTVRERKELGIEFKLATIHEDTFNDDDKIRLFVFNLFFSRIN